MKRLLSIFLALLMTVSALAACKQKNDGQETASGEAGGTTSGTDSDGGDYDDTVVIPDEWLDDSSSSGTADVEDDKDYGTLTLKLPTRIYSNYPAVDIECIFSKPEMAEELTFTASRGNIKIKNGKISAEGVLNVGYTVTVTAKSEHFEAKANVYVESYHGSTASGASLNLETQIITRKQQIAGQSGEAENLNNMVLFVGDSFFNPDNWWTSFYTDYASKKAYTVGISSTTAEDWQVISERLVYPYNPKAVVLHVGTNDIFDDKLSAADTTARLEKLFNTYHEKMPNTKIYWFNVEPRVNQSFAVPKAVNESIAEFAKGKDWLVVIDSASWCFNGNTVNSSFFKDGIHPANEKYALYRQALTDKGLVIENKAGVGDVHSSPNIIRDKSQHVATSHVKYDGKELVNEYVVSGTLTVTDVGSNPHAEFQFRDYLCRFLIRDFDNNGKFGVCWSTSSGATNEAGHEDYIRSSSPLVIQWKVVFTQKNAYFYVNGTLKAVYYNVPNPSHFNLSTEAMTATFTNIKAYTKAADAAVYNEELAKLSVYEANTDSTVRVERVG